MANANIVVTQFVFESLLEGFIYLMRVGRNISGSTGLPVGHLNGKLYQIAKLWWSCNATAPNVQHKETMSHVAKDGDDFLPCRRAPSHNHEVDARPMSLKWQLPGQTLVIPATIISLPPLHLDNPTSDHSSRRTIYKPDTHRQCLHEGPETTKDRLLVSESADHRRGSNGCGIDSVEDVQETQSPRVDSVFDVDNTKSSEAEKVTGELVVCSGALPMEPVNARMQQRTIKDFTLSLQHVDTIDLQSVRCPRRRWHENTPVKFVQNMFATRRELSRPHDPTAQAIVQDHSPAQPDVLRHHLNDNQREADDLRRWLRMYGNDSQWGTIPFG
ncbi:hypothetical protein LTR78_001729 [Recurvomyces mirabilis]|uniref:Uncharacterized protein n=1 Tax=Recurvomyces mirabilis TaxID=574656 RepID=A0AAE0WUL8_9PEZI|nr:hypothetical protein LTR78_001729 [Recurvomyces mirabilis]KAK5150196.1 hypothetical protein LTS14_010325 [Recurvomyces mirabilis]